MEALLGGGSARWRLCLVEALLGGGSAWGGSSRWRLC